MHNDSHQQQYPNPSPYQDGGANADGLTWQQRELMKGGGGGNRRQIYE